MRGKIGGIEGIEQLTIVLLGIALGQHEGFSGMTVAVEHGEVNAAIEAIVTTTVKEEPATVGAPVVQTLGLVAVDFIHRAGNTRLQV